MSLDNKLWQQVARHLDLAASCDGMATILAEFMPLSLLLVRRVEQYPSRLVTIAVGVPGTEGAAGPERPQAGQEGSLVGSPTGPAASWHLPVRTELNGLAQRALDRFFEGGQPVLVPSGQDPAQAEVLMPPGFDAVGMAAPLTLQGEAVGVLAAIAPAGTALAPAHLGVLSAAAEPMAVAFENDQRQRELQRAHQVLEAERALLLERLQRQNLSDVVVGQGGGLRMVLERVAEAAPTNAPILVRGEYGTGKGVLASEIHRRSRRAQGPLVRLNASAFPVEQLEAELFGVSGGEGRLARADGGTLYIDQVHQLPLLQQTRLLRVLEDGVFEQGASQRTVDVRIVAATDQDLEVAVAEGAFSEDLWYRLSVVPMRLPSLRDRLEDLPALANHFAQHAGRRISGVPLRLSDEELELLRRYDWPGNLRELALVVERAAILGRGRVLRVQDALGTFSGADMGSEQDLEVARVEANTRALESIMGLDDAIAAHIRRALVACQGQIEGPCGAAKLLRVNPHTLRARMRMLGLESEA